MPTPSGLATAKKSCLREVPKTCRSNRGDHHKLTLTNATKLPRRGPIIPKRRVLTRLTTKFNTDPTIAGLTSFATFPVPLKHHPQRDNNPCRKPLLAASRLTISPPKRSCPTQNLTK